MRQVTGTLLFLFGQALLGWAQEEAAGASRFFRGKRVAFWGDREAETPRPAPVPSGSESIWAEPQKLPDGRVSVYVPPKPVLDFLDSPSEESGRAYLAWQKERMDKIARASEILSRLVEESRSSQRTEPTGTRGASEEPRPALASSLKARPGDAEKAPAAPRPVAPEILYFKKDGCPHCKHEDETLAELAKERPNVKVRVFKPDEDEALWESLEIKVVPTLVIRGEDGRVHVARGYTPKNLLLEKLGGTK